MQFTRRGAWVPGVLPGTIRDMPKISDSTDDILRRLLEQGGPQLDDRLRKILASQTDVGGKQDGKRELPALVPGATTTVHRVKVSLCGAKPPVWRRLELPSDIGLDLVHEVLQTVFGWYDCHEHQFETSCGDFGDPAQIDDWSPRDNESGVALAQVAREAKAKVTYVYDFGDDWRHDIVVEDVIPAAPGVRYPRCTGGRGNAPEEDSGGIWTHNEAVRADGSGGSTVDAGELTAALHGLSSVIVPAS
jgi:hypothetical protein